MARSEWAVERCVIQRGVRPESHVTVRKRHKRLAISFVACRIENLSRNLRETACYPAGTT